MRRHVLTFALAVLAAVLLSHGAAEARGGHTHGGHWSGRSGTAHSRFGAGHGRGGYGVRSGGRARFRTSFFITAPLFGMGYVPLPSYYTELTGAPGGPVYYTEMTDGYWYYCAEAGRYYPDVQACASPWVRVQARAP